MRLEIDLQGFDKHDDERAFREMVHGALVMIIERIDQMDQNVTNLVTEVTNLKNQRDASNLAWDTLIKMAADAKAQVTALQQQIASGSIDADDAAAIVQAVTDIHDVATSMKTAVPANADPAAPPANPPNASQA